MQSVARPDNDTKGAFVKAFFSVLISALCSIIFYCNVTNAQTSDPPPNAYPPTSLYDSPSLFKESDRRSTGAFSGKKILFISAGDKLSDINDMGMSDLRSMLLSMGFDVTEEYPTLITDTLLQDFDIVVFSNSWRGQREISDNEAQELIDFVNQGNGLLLAGTHGLSSYDVNWNRSINKVGISFGIEVNGDMLCDPTDHLNYSNDPDGGVDVPLISQMSTHDVTSNVSQFILGYGSSLLVTSPAQTIAFSDSDSWRDKNGTWQTDIEHYECIQDGNEQSGSYPIIATAEKSGKVLAIGDTGWMINWILKRYDNYSLAQNIFSWLAEIEPKRGMYVDGTKWIVGNPVRETALLNYISKNSIDYLVFYELHLISNWENSVDLAKLIHKAKKPEYGVRQIGVSGNHEGYSIHFPKAVAFNNKFQDDDNNPAKFDVLNLECEYWNPGSAPDLPNFAGYLSILQYLRDLADANGMIVEAYLGKPCPTEAPMIGSLLDRVLLHYYVKTPQEAYWHSENDICGLTHYLFRDRLSWFANTAKPLDVWPIFSGESGFMGPWLRNNSMSDAEAIFVTDYLVDGLGDTLWKSGINVNGFQYFSYTQLGTIYVNTDGSCGGNSPCYQSIQAAINAAAGAGPLIKIAQGTYTESITLNEPKTLTLLGGWNSSYDAQTSDTTFIKAPSAPQGSLTLQMMTIKP